MLGLELRMRHCNVRAAKGETHDSIKTLRLATSSPPLLAFTNPPLVTSDFLSNTTLDFYKHIGTEIRIPQASDHNDRWVEYLLFPFFFFSF
jgi:hypothetical protein